MQPLIIGLRSVLPGDVHSREAICGDSYTLQPAGGLLAMMIDDDVLKPCSHCISPTNKKTLKTVLTPGMRSPHFCGTPTMTPADNDSRLKNPQTPTPG